MWLIIIQSKISILKIPYRTLASVNVLQYTVYDLREHVYTVKVITLINVKFVYSCTLQQICMFWNYFSSVEHPHTKYKNYGRALRLEIIIYHIFSIV